MSVVRITKTKKTLTQERLKELLDYDPETGEFRWRVNRTGSVKAGDIAGFVRPDGYRQISVDGVLYLTGRLAWLFVHGSFPPEDIDHINRNPSDDRLVNLRLATRTQNNWNTSRRNALGLRGVQKRGVGYQAAIRTSDRRIHLGTFPAPELAHEAYCAAARQFHGEFFTSACKKAA